MVEDYDLMTEDELYKALAEINSKISKKENELTNLKYEKDKVLSRLRFK